MDIAVDAIKAAASSHTFLSVTKQGLSAIVETEGNPSTHVILRGSTKGPNYEAEHVAAAGEKLRKAGLPAKIMVSLSLAPAHARSTAPTVTLASSINARSSLAKTSRNSSPARPLR